MEEIDLMRLLDYFKHKIGGIIFITICIAIIVFVYGVFLQKPLYKSHTTVILGGTEKENASLTQSDVTLNKNLVDTYAEVVKSRRVLEQVIDNLNLNLTYEQLERKISVVSVNNTEIIKIIVTSSNNETAKRIADTTANYFTKEVTRLYKLNNVNILDNAVVSNTPYNINKKKTTVISLLIGLTVSLGIMFVVYYFDRTIKSPEMIEQIIGLPIIGTVQETKTRKKDKRKQWKKN